jgi:hypothetical protein
MLSHPVPEPERQNRSSENRRPRHGSHIPKYVGRWPFVGCTSVSEDEDAVPPSMHERARVEAGVVATDGIVYAIRRNPSVAIVVAAGIGFALALAFTERRR